MNLYYLSDLHFTPESHTQKIFINFLHSRPKPQDTLVLGGDIFDLFLGNKSIFKAQFAPVLSALKQLAQSGCKIYYLEGNHDFHLKKVFLGEKNIIVKENDFSLLWEEKKIWISHGDLVNKKERAYRLFRFLLRTRLLQLLILLLPGNFIYKVSLWLNKKSRLYSDVQKISASQRSHTKELFRKYARAKIQSGFHLVFLGHSHIEDQKEFHFSDHSGLYLNLGFSNKCVLYATYESPKNTLSSYSLSE